MLTVNNSKLNVYEVFDKVKSTKSRKDKILVLKENDTMALLDVLRGAFDPTIQWNLPVGEVPFTPAEEESPPSSLLKQHLKFKYFVKGLRESSTLRSVKREQMFIDMCESVHPRDAEVIVAMINKKSPAKGITKKLIQEAFPRLIIE